MTRDWKTLARRVVYAHPPWLEVAIEKLELPDGTIVDDYVQLRGRDFAIVAAFTDDGGIVMVRAYKHGIRRVALALPAGYVEAGEAPADGARRELLEETGYEASRWTALGSFVVDSNYGLGTEHVFVAHGARKTREPQSGDLEDIEVVPMPVADARAALLGGEIVQLSSAAALSLALLRR